jgi:enoyl-CoA hydratase/carnithine racemase
LSSTEAPRPGRLRLDEPAPHVARLTISHPERRGALDHPILDRFATILPELDARCLIITGEAGMFSAGYDIADLPEDAFAGEAERLVAHPFTAALDAVEAYPYPTLAVLGGHAIGGGLELALACDLRIAAADARFGMPPARLGIVYSHTGIRTFLDAIGTPRTRQLFLLGERIDAATALAWGLVNEVRPGGELAEAALALATRLAGGAPLAQAGNKRVIRAMRDGAAGLAPGVERELLELRQASFASDDFREGVRAFAEKRAPDWSGR